MAWNPRRISTITSVENPLGLDLTNSSLDAPSSYQSRLRARSHVGSLMRTHLCTSICVDLTSGAACRTERSSSTALLLTRFPRFMQQSCPLVSTEFKKNQEQRRKYNIPKPRSKVLSKRLRHSTPVFRSRLYRVRCPHYPWLPTSKLATCMEAYFQLQVFGGCNSH